MVKELEGPKEGAGFRAQAFGGFLKTPIVAFIIALILFGPTVIISLMKTLPFIPLHIWIVLAVVFFAYRALK